MNPYQRVSLISEIAYKLQAEMTTRDINILLQPYQLTRNPETTVSSKRVYVQEMLANEPMEKVVKIAADIGIDISPYNEAAQSAQPSSGVWTSGKQKVFISHLAKDKEKASKIQHDLLLSNISGFVAHEDIEPTRDWQDSIESALKTMDVLVALITPGFFSSTWTNQEIGYALGLNKRIITVKIGDDPKGFIGRYQAINGKGRLPKDIVADIVKHLNA